MADSESTKGKSSGRAAADKQAAGNGENGTEAPPTIPVGQLIADGPTLLGHPSHAVAGALSGHDPDEELVIDEAKVVVEEWLQRPVEVDPATVDEEEES